MMRTRTRAKEQSQTPAPLGTPASSSTSVPSSKQTASQQSLQTSTTKSGQKRSRANTPDVLQSASDNCASELDGENDVIERRATPLPRQSASPAPKKVTIFSINFYSVFSLL